MHVRTHAFMHAYPPIYIPTYLHTYLHTYIPTYLPCGVPASLHTYIPTYLHTCPAAYLHPCIPTYLRTYRYVRKHAGTQAPFSTSEIKDQSRVQTFRGVLNAPETIRPWVKIQIVPPVNMRFNPTTKIGSIIWVVNSPTQNGIPWVLTTTATKGWLLLRGSQRDRCRPPGQSEPEALPDAPSTWRRRGVCDVGGADRLAEQVEDLRSKARLFGHVVAQKTGIPKWREVEGAKTCVTSPVYF